MQHEPLNVMLDPSILLDARAYSQVRRQWDVLLGREANVFVPNALVVILSSYLAENTDYGTVEAFTRFYIDEGTERTSLEELIRVLGIDRDTGRLVLPFLPEDEAYVHEDFYYALREELETVGDVGPLLANSIFEEWVFLQEVSWITSHTTAAFTWMARAGGVIVQAGRRSLDRIATKTLNKDAQYKLDTAERLLALGKWVAFAGVTGIGAAIGAAAGASVGAAILGPVFGTVGRQAIFMIDP
jgi:hypothetical protein